MKKPDGSPAKTKESKCKRMVIEKANQTLVKYAQDAGKNIDGFEHEISKDFITHVLKDHGDEKKESLSGQVAIKPEDFDKIPEIIKAPDLISIGANNGKHDLIAYTKKRSDGTTFYLEEILDSTRNKALRSKTMFKRKGNIDKNQFIKFVSNDNKTNISKAKIYGR